jgi:uncharacterized protein (TIGR02996 family)
MRLAPKAHQRVRREFFPEDYARAMDLLTRWDTKACTRESPPRMHAAVLNLARGSLRELKRAIKMAKQDFRDVLLYGEGAEYKDHRCIVCQPGERAASPEEEAFLDGIRRKPADNAVRLIYSDWLQDRGEEIRAEYLRVLCRWLDGRPDAEGQLIARERELRPGLGRAWLARIRGMPVRLKAKKAARPRLIGEDRLQLLRVEVERLAAEADMPIEDLRNLPYYHAIVYYVMFSHLLDAMRARLGGIDDNTALANAFFWYSVVFEYSHEIKVRSPLAEEPTMDSIEGAPSLYFTDRDYLTIIQASQDYVAAHPLSRAQKAAARKARFW